MLYVSLIPKAYKKAIIRNETCIINEMHHIKIDIKNYLDINLILART